MYVKNWSDFEVGDEIDACDKFKKWYESEIRQVENDRIFVHFKGWKDSWDEWYDLTEDMEKLAPKNTHTVGPHKSKSASATIVPSYGPSSYSSSYTPYSYSYGNDKGTHTAIFCAQQNTIYFYFAQVLPT